MYFGWNINDDNNQSENKRRLSPVHLRLFKAYSLQAMWKSTHVIYLCVFIYEICYKLDTYYGMYYIDSKTLKSTRFIYFLFIIDVNFDW